MAFFLMMWRFFIIKKLHISLSFPIKPSSILDYALIFLVTKLTELLLFFCFFGTYIDFLTNLHLILTSWLLQAVLPLLSLKLKDVKWNPQFELKRKNNKIRIIYEKKRWRYSFDRPLENILLIIYGREMPSKCGCYLVLALASSFYKISYFTVSKATLFIISYYFIIHWTSKFL